MPISIPATIVIENFDFTPEKPKGDLILEINGRSSGIVGRILTLLGIGTRSSVRVTQREVTFTFRSLAGTNYIVCPFHAIRCVEAGVAKPLWMLYLGIPLALYGLRGAWMYLTSEFYRSYVQFFGQEALTILAALGVGIGLVAVYVTTKNLAITFSTGSMGNMVGLGFSASKVNGVDINASRILEAIAYINRQMVLSRTGDSVPTGDYTAPAEIAAMLAEDEAAAQRAAEMRARLKQGALNGASKGLAMAQAGATKAADLAKTTASEAEKRLNEAQQRRTESVVSDDAVSPMMAEPANAHSLMNGDLGWLGDDLQPNPEAARAAFRRANMHGKEGKTTGKRSEFEKARAAFEEAITLDPEYIDAYRYLAQTCKLLDDVDAYERYMGEYERRKAKIES